MAGSKSGGITLEFQKQSYENLNKQMENLRKVAPENAYKFLVKLLFDIKFLAQDKLKSDRHIDKSRLRNSIYVQTPGQKYAKRAKNYENYTDKDGKTYKSTLDVQLNANEGAVGTNVEYANAIEYGYGAHTIEVKNAKQLMTKKGDQWLFFGKKVQHPGFKGDSFLHWALKNVDINKRVRELSKELLPDIHKGKTNEKL